MEIKYYPDQKTVESAIQVDDPLLILVSHDSETIILSNIDDAGEHLILLRLMNYRETELDNFFRIVMNQEGADWTFVCPSKYKNIQNKDVRLKQFYNDGITAIAKAIHVIGYECEINIPPRYRRHFNMLGD